MTIWSRGTELIAAPTIFSVPYDARGVEQVDTRSNASRTMATASASLLPVPRPSRLKPPQPNPATLTFSPVRPSVVYSIDNSSR
jgi:hypothetical protein